MFIISLIFEKKIDSLEIIYKLYTLFCFSKIEIISEKISYLFVTYFTIENCLLGAFVYMSNVVTY